MLNLVNQLENQEELIIEMVFYKGILMELTLLLSIIK